MILEENEKNAIEDAKEIVSVYKYGVPYLNSTNMNEIMKTLLNIIEKQILEISALENTKTNCPELNTSGVSCKLKYRSWKEHMDNIDATILQEFNPIQEAVRRSVVNHDAAQLAKMILEGTLYIQRDPRTFAYILKSKVTGEEMILPPETYKNISDILEREGWYGQ